ncbi:isopentenyl-diphosphate Delta-isomerase [Marinilongibacter aquaticus]|uniref:isopentenyl-diphosphate Delta-isomerase n=1 Tax=Marinilongibacter aquaticus TaxID=2975157 RepID=UPI0021BD1062|nr:isopentenyl-diphosphate Delta-isomerase [Marinilongibacter aquaticus]UBM57781.1 isopentenyl-diphosphate Delta-isomerase [Marinilongibacter aquaticus]
MEKDGQIIITLVNEKDEITGYAEKIEVHKKALLHRAFSVVIFNREGQMLIHQRAFSKYHSPGLWTNACCGHPNKGEEIDDAAFRRLGEEMGFRCPLHHRFTFHYKAAFDNGLTENEIDHVFYGQFDDHFVFNPDEVADFRWVNLSEIKQEVKEKPETFTVWFREILRRID